MAKNLLLMFVAGLLLGSAVHITQPVRDWWVMGGSLVGVAVGAMALPALIAAVGATIRKLKKRPIAGFYFAPLWGIWGLFALSYVADTVIRLRLDLAACLQ